MIHICIFFTNIKITINLVNDVLNKNEKIEMKWVLEKGANFHDFVDSIVHGA